MSDQVAFKVHGQPVQQGSKKAFVVNNRAVIVDDNKKQLKSYRNDIASAGREQMDTDPWRIPVHVNIDFLMARPKSHFGTGKNAENVKESAPLWHASKPDIDKLVRSVLDGITGVVIHDDSQVAALLVTKMYGTSPQTVVTVTRLE